jgi:hypothetical protein
VVTTSQRRVDAAAHQGDVHDRARPAGAHLGQHQLREPDRTEHVDLELPSPLVGVEVIRGAVGAMPALLTSTSMRPAK